MRDISTQKTLEITLINYEDLIFKMLLLFLVPMKLRFYNASDYDRNLRCTIHTSGKLGFTDAAKRKLGLNPELTKYAHIAKNDEDASDENLYMIVTDATDAEAFKFIKAGHYYYLNTAPLFDMMELDYQKDSISFDIREMPDEQYGKIYKLIKRQKPRTEDDEQIDE